MIHDRKKKTVYYDNAVIKVYDIPIFYIPRLSHPDPTVDRRTGFLPPAFSDSKNLGAGLNIPFFWSLGPDKNFTLNNKVFLKFSNQLGCQRHGSQNNLINVLLNFFQKLIY